jgi:hypothetical protein
MPQERNANLAYEIISDIELFDLLCLFEKQIKKFILDNNYPDDLEYFICSRDLLDLIIRVDKREAYFYCFHDIEISERKKAALYAYWILKFRPIKIIDFRYINTEKANTVNEAFAIYMICSILKFSKKLPYNKVKKDTYYKKLMYAFRFRNISMDSMLLIVESINPTTFNIKYSDIV